MDGTATSLNVLLVGVSRGDRVAFERLYRRTSPRLYGICLGVLRRPDLAEEVLQEVYVQLWRDAPRHAPTVRNPMGWLGVMARRRAIDVLRQGRRELSTPDDELPEAATPPEEDPGIRADRLSEAAALESCMRGLEPQRREAIRLAFIHGLSHRELSASLAQPAGTVKSWIRRGLLQLRRCLER